MDHFLIIFFCGILLSCMKYILKQIILYKFIKSLLNLFIHFPIAYFKKRIFPISKQLEHKVIRTSYYFVDVVVWLSLLSCLMRIYIQMMIFQQKKKKLVLNNLKNCETRKLISCFVFSLIL